MADSKSRAGFLGIGATGLSGSALASDAPQEIVTEGAFDARFDGDTFFLQLDNDKAGWIFEPQGGEAVADVVTEKLGSSGFVAKKHIGNVKYNEFSVQCGLGMTKGLYEWVKNSWDGNYARRNGLVIAADFDYKAKAAARFSDALITEVTVPVLDGGSKEPAYFYIKLRPTLTAYEAPGAVDPKLQTKPGPTNFDLKIDGLDTSRVTKIEAFTVKQGFSESATGNGDLEPSHLEIPNLSIWVDPVGADTWYAWADDFLLNGNNGDAKERNGSLVFLDPTRQKSLLELSFSHLGIFKGTPEASENNSDKIRRVKFEMYSESITMKLGDSGWA